MLRAAELWPAAREAQDPVAPAAEAAARGVTPGPGLAADPVAATDPPAATDTTGGADAAMAMDLVVHRIARSLVGHGGVALVDVEDSARQLRSLLLAEFERQAERTNAVLPPGMVLHAAAVELAPPPAVDGYRYLADGQFALRVELQVSQPVELHAHCTPVVGIVVDRHSRNTFQVLDAEPPRATAAPMGTLNPPPRPLLLPIGDVRPHLSPRAAHDLAHWADVQLRRLLADVGPALKKRFS